jgi:hypothetical protein
VNNKLKQETKRAAEKSAALFVFSSRPFSIQQWQQRPS